MQIFERYASHTVYRSFQNIIQLIINYTVKSSNPLIANSNLGKFQLQIHKVLLNTHELKHQNVRRFLKLALRTLSKVRIYDLQRLKDENRE